MKKRLLDREIVERDRDFLYLGNLNTVEFDLTLPERGRYGSKISWKSGHDRFLSDEGMVSRPEYGMGDRTVPLIATFSYGTAEVTKQYEVRILEKENQFQVSSVYPVKVIAEASKEILLPQAAVVMTKSGSIISHLVKWDEGNRVKFETPGSYRRTGVLFDTGILVTADITIISKVEDQGMDFSPRVRECSLAEVKLTEGSLFYDSQENMLKFLLYVDDDQMLYNFRIASGLDTKGASPMEGWDAPDSQLRGHTTGHYLSALALCYHATGNQKIKAKAVYMVAALEECQNAFAKQPGIKEGFLSGYSEDQFDLLEEYTRYPVIWAPYYTLHKILAGLLDCYHFIESEKALIIAEKLGMWTWNRLSKLPEEQRSKMWSLYIAGEFGGMNAVMAELFEITEKEEYLKCAELFHNDKLFYPLEQKIDALDSMHANQHIPQILGAMELFKATGEKKYYELSEFFWQTVVSSHCYANGGTGEGEMFHKSGKIGALLDKDTAETCASYNMLKLTKELYQLSPKASYMDYYERTLINHILASQDQRVTGESTYFLPLGPGMKREFLFENSCCHGTGMESRFKYREGIYFFDEKGSVYINLFIPSEMNWKERDIRITQKTDRRAPEVIRIHAEGSGLNTIKIRKPYWANRYQILGNNEEMTVAVDGNGYIIISLDFSQGTDLYLKFFYDFHLIRTPDKPERTAVQFGPYLMAVLSEQKDFIRFTFDESDIADKMHCTEDPLRFECEGYTFVPICEVGMNTYHAYIVCG